MKTHTEVDHLILISESEDVATTIDAETFKPFRVLLEGQGLPLGFSAGMRAEAAEYQLELTERDDSDSESNENFGDAREEANGAKVLVKYSHNRLELLQLCGDKDFRGLSKRLMLGTAELGSPLRIRATALRVLHVLASDPRAPKLGIPESLVTSARDAVAAIAREHAGGVVARTDRETETEQLWVHNANLTTMLATLAVCVEAVEMLHPVKVPGLDLALLRSMAARRRPKSPVEGDAEPEPDEGEGNGFS